MQLQSPLGNKVGDRTFSCHFNGLQDIDSQGWKVSIAIRVDVNILSYNWDQTRIIKNGKRRKNYKEIKSRSKRESSEIFHSFIAKSKSLFLSLKEILVNYINETTNLKNRTNVEKNLMVLKQEKHLQCMIHSVLDSKTNMFASD